MANPLGRPIRLPEPDVQTAIIEDLRLAYSVQASVESHGVLRQTFDRWMAQGAEDEESDVDSPVREFRARVVRARAAGLKLVEEWIRGARGRRATGAQPDIALQIAARQWPNVWREVLRTEITGDAGEEDLSALTEKELDERIARYDAAAAIAASSRKRTKSAARTGGASKPRKPARVQRARVRADTAGSHEAGDGGSAGD